MIRLMRYPLLCLAVTVLGLDLGHAAELTMTPREFEFRLPAGAGQPDPEHQQDGVYKYRLESYVFPENDIISSNQPGVSAVGKIFSEYLVAAKSGNVEDLKKLYSDEALPELTKILSDPQAVGRFLKALSALEGVQPLLAVDAGDSLTIVYAFTKRNGKMTASPTPFLLRKKGGAYMMAAGKLPDSMAITNLSTFMMTSPFKELKITPR